MTTAFDMLQDLRRRGTETSLRRLRHHPTQQAFWHSEARFAAACAGRRSGKSDIARRKLAKKAVNAHIDIPDVPDPLFVITCPTRDQVKRLHWEPLKRLFPRNLVVAVSETELTVTLINGARVRCIGLDKHERAEGEAIDGAVIDEIADTKESAWTLSLRPSLSTDGRPGWAIFIGKPRGRNHWWRIWSEAADKAGWAQFHWSAEDILAPEEIESLKADLDPLSYAQEVRADFVNFQGRAYYAFFRGVQDTHKLEYDPTRPLDLHFDFNVAPGVAIASQEQFWQVRTNFSPVWYAGAWVEPYIDGDYTACLHTIHIPNDSNTLRVCRAIVARWSAVHKGVVRLFGDATGGQRRTVGDGGNDWDIVREELRKVRHWSVRSFVPSVNPSPRDRINALNSRLMAANGRVRCMIDPQGCDPLVVDLEAVTTSQDGSGDVDKRSDPFATHLTDALGYRISRSFPVHRREINAVQV